MTGSTAERGDLCPSSFHLPQTRTIDPPVARLGTAIHAFLRDGLVVGRDEALAAIEDEKLREVMAAIQFDKLPHAHPDGYRAEVGLALDVVTGKARILGEGMTHDQMVAMLGPNENGCVVDVLGQTPDKTTAIVFDVKTGWRRLAPAQGNRQIHLGAIAASRALGCSRAVGALLYVRQEDRAPWSDVATFQRLDLDEIFDAFVDIRFRYEMARITVSEGKEPDLVVGEHCTYCPAFDSCRAQKGILERWRAAPEEAATPAFTAISDARIEDAIVEADNIERVLKRVRQAIHARATVQPVRLRNGLIYGPVVQEKDAIDGKKGQAGLVDADAWRAAALAAKIDDIAVPTEADVARVLSWIVTKRAVQTLAATRAPRGKATKLAEAVVEQLRARGAVAKKTHVVVKAHRADENKENADD